MIKEARRNSLLKKQRAIKKSETTLKRQRQELAEELREATENEGSSLQELGNLIGISRQRVFQLVKADRG